MLTTSRPRVLGVLRNGSRAGCGAQGCLWWLCDTPVEALWLLGFVCCDTPVGCVGGGCGVGFSLAAARGLVRFFRVGVVGVFGGLRTQ